MEFPFDTKNLLPDSIVLVDSDYSCIRRNKVDSYEQAKNNLTRIIDEMGAASSKAQSLRGCITSGMKLRCSDHRLYILTDSSENKHAVAGILKVGVKRLFVMDLQNNQLEVNPLCVLDFYIHESKQRTGYGKKLFEFMLKNENVVAANLAYDRPSNKFLSFLKKHYDLKNPYHQVNNFVVYDLFFRDLQAVGYVQSRNRLGTSNSRPPLHPYRRVTGPAYNQNNDRSKPWDRPTGRHSASRPCPYNQQVGDESQQVQVENYILPPINLSTTSRCVTTDGHSEVREESDATNSHRGLGARASLYSRHTVSRNGSASNRRIPSRPSSGTKADGTASKGDSRPNSGQRTARMEQSTVQVISTKHGEPQPIQRIKTYSRTTAGASIKNDLNDLLDSNGNYTLTKDNCPIRNLQKSSHDNPLVNMNSHNRAVGHDSSSNSSCYQSIINNRSVIRSAPVQTSRINPSIATNNYTVSNMYNSNYGPSPSLGSSSWNIFGVPAISKTANSRTLQTWRKPFPF